MLSENENTPVKSCGKQCKLCLKGKLTALNACISKEERFIINNLRFHIKKLEKEEQFKPKGSTRK